MGAVRYCFALVVILSMALTGQADDGLTQSVQAPPGFEVRLFADHDLAPDIYSLTFNATGRVVVSGRGYVRILLDEDRDGVADSYQQFANGPDTGSMGMFWDGTDLICTGDAGLLRYRDANGDGRADGPPEVLLEAKTGGEHDVHAIRKGPDGWWYLLGGNNAQLDERYVTLPSSPVTSPRAGALIRLSPEFASCEVIADGFRNPYDFAFNAQGRLFTYDSDGERDVSLPWYRPTRVFEILPGMHAGWFSRSWKRPDHFIDMPPVVAAFGRGSPTGVVCYRHNQFPAKYRDGLFVLDWTYGRVLFVPPVDNQGRPIRDPEEFVTGIGSFGFAPTDAAVSPDGSLFVSVGGRGTRGGVYRIRWTGPDGRWPNASPLEQCLRAPQPLCSWSRAKWEPLLANLRAEELQAAALDEQRPPSERVRAIEILCEHFGGIDAAIAERLLDSSSSSVRARTVWSAGRHGDRSMAPIIARRFRDEVLVVRAAAEVQRVFLSADQQQPNGKAAADMSLPYEPTLLVPALSTGDRGVQHAVTQVLALCDAATFRKLAAEVDPSDVNARITLCWARLLRGGEDRRAGVVELLTLIETPIRSESRIDAARLLQVALGDVGPGRHAAVFDGYTVPGEFPLPDAVVERMRSLVKEAFPAEDPQLDYELARLIAILQPAQAHVLEHVLQQVTPDSHPVDDVHYLIVAARLPAARTAAQTRQVAERLLAIDEKVDQRGLHRDANWDVRLGEMYVALADQDPRLPEVLIRQESFGQPGHVLYVENLSAALRQHAIDAFVRTIKADPDYQWNNDVVRLLSTSERGDIRLLLRRQAGEFSVQSSVLMALAQRPQPEERQLFVDGLQSSEVSVLRQMVKALERLGPNDAAAEQVSLVRTLRRVGDSDAEQTLKQAILRRLEENTGIAQQASGGRESSDGTIGSLTPPARLSETLRAQTATWSERARQHFPDEWARQTGATAADTSQLQALLETVDWTAGVAERGNRLFYKRSCAECHGGRRALGPDLRGAAGRFSRSDLFTAIALPHRDVSPRYQTTFLVTHDGRTHTGIVVYESIDGLLLRNSRGETVRIESSEVDVRRQMTRSLMPEGLLKDLTPSDLADLYAYLQTLR